MKNKMHKNQEELIRLKHTHTKLSANEIAELDREVPHIDLPFPVEELTFYERDIPFDVNKMIQEVSNKHINHDKEKDK